MDTTKLPQWGAQLRDRGWTIEPTPDGIICDYPDGADCREWGAELHDLTKHHFGPWGWTIKEQPNGAFVMKLESDES